MARWYVGKLHTGTRVPFSSDRVPTRRKFGKMYAFVEGPFESRSGAHHFANVWNGGGQITQDMAEHFVASQRAGRQPRSDSHTSRVLRMRARSGR